MLKRTLIYILLMILVPMCQASGTIYSRFETDVVKENRYQEIIHKSVYLAGYQFLLVYGLSRLNESITKWKPEQRRVKNFGRNWVKNVKSLPVFDGDPLAINYIGHPWGGAGYYCMARQTGLTPKESFFYTVIESTFLWEYGFEAMVERPSIQDFIITPAVGSILGEIKYREIKRIEANGGMVMGSRTMGSIAIALLSPYNALVEATRSIFNDTDNAPEIAANFTITPTQHKSNRFLFTMHFAV